MAKYPPTIFIQARGLPDAWGQAVNKIMKEGMIIGTQYGTRSKDVCSIIEILSPESIPLLHPQFPTKELHTAEYVKQWERGYEWIAQGFEYNYMDRLIHNPKPRLECDDNIITLQQKAGKKTEPYYNHSPNPEDNFVDQITRIREELPKGVSRRLQATTWIPERDLFVKEDQPCLQRLWFRNLGDNNVEMHCMWRSRDCYAAWNSNMVGLLTMVKREILEPNELDLVKIIDFCNSLHIYEADWEAAAQVKRVAVNLSQR